MANRFDQFMAWINCPECHLPFQFGGATQCGRLNTHNNNQDAMALWSRSQCIVGVVCDGCSTSAGSFSNNEVGARIIAMVTTEIVGAMCQAISVNKLADELSELELRICERITQLADIVALERQRDE